MAYASENLAELWIISPGFDDLLVNGDTTDADGMTYTIDATDDGASWDSPVPVDVAVQRWMTDGAVAATQGHENRTPTFQVRVSAATSSDLAAGEAALVKRSARPCLLKWVPPEGSPEAPATVFEVWTWHLSHTFNGTDERHLQRYYTLTFTAKPWARSANLTTAVAPIPPGTPTTVPVDACTSTAGWTTNGGLMSTSGGAIIVTTHTTMVANITLTRTGLVTGMASTPYLMIDMTFVAEFVLGVTVSIDGATLTKVTQVGTVSYYQVPAGVSQFTTLKISGRSNGSITPGYQWTMTIFDVSRTDTIGSVGSAKQLSRHLDVGGSVKTSGSIQLASPSATTLGACLIYTTPDTGTGFSSAMRTYRTSGNTVTPDTSCVSGNREAFVTSGSTAGVINYALPPGTPEATYVVVGRFVFSNAGSIQVTFASVVGLNQGNFGASVAASGAGVVWAVLGVLPAPWVALPSGSSVGPQFQAAAGGSAGVTASVDEFYLLDVTRGSFTLVTGVGRTRLWIDAPDADPLRNRPGIYVGSQSDRSDAFGADQSNVLSLGDHDFDPDGMTLFTVTDGVDNAAASASFYRRWHTHAGD